MANIFSWTDEASWPVDTPSYVFLRRAIQQIGMAITGEDNILANEAGPNAQSVIRQAHQDFIAGALVAGIRKREGGEIWSISADDWITENIDSRFRFGILNALYPHVPVEDPDDEWEDGWRHQCYIYVTRKSLDARIAANGGAPADGIAPEANEPALLPAEVPLPASHNETWAAAADWLTAQVEAWRHGNGKRLTKTAVESALRDRFGLRSPRARDVWAQKTPVEWRIRGRHRK
ncbi:hypothetical protein LGH82_22910 [Mesorhizobium sp. PAMC28654]|uniref:hypothetical protein n=1 Tax=Mesorhizobium sp. PAMC28654 TaxID=2880934 RepID=UPI001D0BA630|nr:hypothetical protein [Mesorhizobium sp. PAMC28654]UDL87991.1 hypothetical protein LGH82_22910 [Mesorhizobium sp. PAMC28654]